MSTATLQIEKKKTLVPQLRFQEFDGEWVLKKLIDFAPLQRGFDLPVVDIKQGKYPVVFSNGILKTHNEFKAKAPGVVTGRSGTIGKITFVEEDYWPHNTALWVTDFKNNDAKFVYFFYSNFKLERLGTGSGVPTLNRNDVHAKKAFFPNLPEQQKIASFLSAVDEKIQQLSRKKGLLEQYKKGVMQQLFSGKLRFKDENGKDYPDWKEKRIGEIFENRNETGYNEMELLSISINKGVYSQSESNKTDNSNNDKSKYKRVLIGDIAYNSMRMWQGASAVSSLDGIVSPAYTILQHNENNCSEYFGFLFKMSRMVQTFQKHSQGLTSDTWNLKYPMISRIKVMRPCLKEQQKNADFLSSIDRKIESTNQQLAQMQSFKKGLLQQMFV